MIPNKLYYSFPSLPIAVSAYALVYLLVLCVCWVLGKLLLTYTQSTQRMEGKYGILFFELLVGLVYLTVGFALFATKGKTELVGMLAFVSVSIYWFGQEKSVSPTDKSVNSITHFFLLLLLALLIFLSFAWYKIPYANCLYPGYMGDYLYYAEIAEFAYKTGNENIYAVSNLFGPAYTGASPYHFFDIWLNVIVAECTGWPYVAVLESIVWAVFRFIAVVGVLAIAEKQVKINPIVAMLCGLLLFFAAWYFPVFDSVAFLKYNNKLMQSVVDGKKIAATCLFFIGFYLLWRWKSPKAALCLLMAGSFASIGNVMGIAGGIGAMGVFYFVWKDKKMAIFSWGISIGTLVAIALFYKFFGSGFPAVDYSLVLQHTVQSPIPKLKFLAGYLITGVVYNFLLVGIWGWGSFRMGFFKELKAVSGSAVLILLLVLFFGAVAAALFTGEFQDGDQFYMNVYIPVLFLLVFLAFLYLPQLLNLPRFTYQIILVGASLYACYQGISTYQTDKTNTAFWASNYSAEYLTTVKTHLHHIQNPIGGSINSISPDPFYHKKYYIYNPLGYYMKTLAKGYHTVGLSYYKICTQCAGFQFLCQRDRFGFYNFATEKLKENDQLSVADLQMQFIQQFSLDYLIVEANGIIPPLLVKNIQLVAQDSISGESFYLINQGN